MTGYLLRRLLLLPLTLFCIILVNFVIINLAPGDPTTVTEVTEGRAEKKEGSAQIFGSDLRYLQFREYFGLTLPILFNTWPWISQNTVNHQLETLEYRQKEIPFKEYDALRIQFGDQAKYVMPKLMAIMIDKEEKIKMRTGAARFFIRGATKQAYLGSSLSEEQKLANRKIAKDNQFLLETMPLPEDPQEVTEKKIGSLQNWYEENSSLSHFSPDTSEKINIFFLDTRFFRYFSRVLTLDFGTLREDPNKTVLSEVAKRIKYSLTLTMIPMVITFVLCIVIGFTMALCQYQWPDYSLNLLCLILYAIPIFVVAPFLIENVALNHTFPFTHIPIPISGFTSPEPIYEQMSSRERILDIISHIALPILAITYGSFAAQARLARTAVLEVMRHDFVRTARAKGVAPFPLMAKHIGRNAAITIVTSIAASLGILLGGSLIVETVFEIDGFGQFFYKAVVNRDYNVIMFSAIAGSLLTLVGYLMADLTYTFLDPRVTLE